MDSVIKVGDTYYLYYAGGPNTQSSHIHVHLATSKSPLGPWEKFEGNPVLTEGPFPSWSDQSVDRARVYRFGDKYYMFHEGQQYAEGGHYPWRLGVAIADAPEGPWREYAGNPLIDVGESEEWDSVAIYNGSVVNVGDQWYMWYSGFGKHPDQFGQIGLATAPSPLGPWTKYPGNPVLTHGPPGSWSAFGLQEPYVIFYQGLFHMWVSGNPDPDKPMQAAIGYFWSRDGIHWMEHPQNPVLPTGPPGSWDYPNVSEPFVYIEGDTLYLFYEGFSNPDELPIAMQQDIAILSSAVGLATAKICP